MFLKSIILVGITGLTVLCDLVGDLSTWLFKYLDDRVLIKISNLAYDPDGLLPSNY